MPREQLTPLRERREFLPFKDWNFVRGQGYNVFQEHNFHSNLQLLITILKMRQGNLTSPTSTLHLYRLFERITNEMLICLAVQACADDKAKRLLEAVEKLESAKSKCELKGSKNPLNLDFIQRYLLEFRAEKPKKATV